MRKYGNARRLLAWAALAAIVVLPAPARADSAAPAVLSFERRSPATVGGAAPVTIRYHARDAGGSNLWDVVFSYRSPLGDFFGVFDRQPVGEVTADATARMRTWSGSGTWQLEQITVSDRANNITTYRRDGSVSVWPDSLTTPPPLATPLSSADFTVDNPNEDVTPPVLASVSLLEQNVAAGDPVVVVYSATDNRSGVARLDVQYETPTGITAYASVPPDLGAVGPAVWTVPMASPGGLYKVASLTVTDHADNAVWWNRDQQMEWRPAAAPAPTQQAPDVRAIEFTVDPKTEDRAGPVLDSLSVASSSGLPRGGLVDVRYSAHDDLTGIESIWAVWKDAAGHELEARKQCGDMTGGPLSVRVPTWSPPGTVWRLQSFRMQDGIGNGGGAERNAAHSFDFAKADFTVTDGVPPESNVRSTTDTYCPETPTVTLTTSTPEAEAGDPVVLSGAVVRAATAVPVPLVALYAYDGTGPSLLGIQRGAATGRYGRSVAMPKASAVRARFLGADGTNPAVEARSATVPIRIGLRTSLVASVPSFTTVGIPVTLSGRLIRSGSTWGVAGQSVKLFARRRGSQTFVYSTAATTASDGKVWFKLSPAANTEYQIRYGAAGPWLSSTSSIVTVYVRPRLTVFADRYSMPLGSRATILVTVAPGHAGQPVVLQRESGGVWRDVARATLTSRSAASFAVAPTTKGYHRYRVTKPYDGDHAAGFSGPLTLRLG